LVPATPALLMYSSWLYCHDLVSVPSFTKADFATGRCEYHTRGKEFKRPFYSLTDQLSVNIIRQVTAKPKPFIVRIP